MRVLFVSDVYFPRVNGVSTSIRTFRADLARESVETLLIAPEYPGAALDNESERLVPRQRNSRRMGGPRNRRRRDGTLVGGATPPVDAFATGSS